MEIPITPSTLLIKLEFLRGYSPVGRARRGCENYPELLRTSRFTNLSGCAVRYRVVLVVVHCVHGISTKVLLTCLLNRHKAVVASKTVNHVRRGHKTYT